MQHPSKWLVMAALVASTLLGIAACSADVPERPFDCAGEVCDANTEYCLQVSENGSEEGDRWYCRRYPAECALTPTCECIQDPFSDCDCYDDKGEVRACFYSPG